MPAITEIRPLPSDPNMRRVRVGNKTVATLRASDVESLQLAVGAAWTAKLQHAADRATALIKARRDAMKLLGRRQLSRAELIQKLSAKTYEREICEQLADEMTRERWIDDVSMAASLADELIHRQSAGQKLLKAKLNARQIDVNLAEKVSRAAASPSHQFASALQLAKRKLHSLADQSAVVAARRIAGTLGRKGFDDEVIERVIHELNLCRDSFDE